MIFKIIAILLLIALAVIEYKLSKENKELKKQNNELKTESRFSTGIINDLIGAVNKRGKAIEAVCSALPVSTLPKINSKMDGLYEFKRQKDEEGKNKTVLIEVEQEEVVDEEESEQ